MLSAHRSGAGAVRFSRCLRVLYGSNYGDRRLWRIYDAKLNMTEFSYDPTNRKARKTFPDSTYEESTFDAAGNRTSFRNRSAQVATSVFNANNWKTSQNCPTCGATFTYDDNGNLTQAVDANAGTYTFTYDKLNRVTQESQPSGTTGSGAYLVDYAYDAVGNLTVLDVQDAGNVRRADAGYSYDSRNRLTGVNDVSGGDSYSLTYDAGGRRTLLNYPGTFGDTHYTYNAADRLTAIETKTSGGTTVDKTAYGLDAFGNRTSKTNSFTGYSLARTYTYDVKNQLDTVTKPGLAYDYSYDELGNRTSLYDSGYPIHTYTSNNLNQYATYSSGSVGYDTRGNMTTLGGLTLGYDTDNRLTSVAKSGSSTDTYTYDWRHRLVEKRVGANDVTRYVYAGWHVVAEARATTAGATPVLTTRYLINPQNTDEILAQQDFSGSSSTNTHYLLKDGLGSTTAVVAKSGWSVAQRYDYDEFGAFKVLNASGGYIGGTPLTNYLFTGREYQGDGLWNYRNRFYSAELGRFLQTDPIGESGGINLYGYVGNDPAQLVDPFGLSEEVDELEECRGDKESSPWWKRLYNAARHMLNGTDKYYENGNRGTPRPPKATPSAGQAGKAALKKGLGIVGGAGVQAGEIGAPGTEALAEIDNNVVYLLDMLEWDNGEHNGPPARRRDGLVIDD